MDFGTIKTERAEGAILAHTLALGGRTLRKGHRLSADDIAWLVQHVTEVVVARLSPDDIDEDMAASRIASRTVEGAAHVRVSAAFTGRANIIATKPGVVELDRTRIEAVNAIDERITIATLEPYAVVAAETLIATIKIIPFAVPASAVDKVCDVLSATRPALSIAPFTKKRVALVISHLPGQKQDVLTKRHRTTLARLTERGASLGHTETVPHTVAAIRDALVKLDPTKWDAILLFSATAIVDRGDVVPAAIEAAGGINHRLGMPVDPGNLLLLSALGATPLIGIPSCAASPKLNGFDWVLDRVLAGLAPTSVDLARMGVGGLLKEIPSRPQPRSEQAIMPDLREAPRIAALVLAAGRSSRMEHEHKLLADLEGKPLIRHTVEAALASSVKTVVVVVGHEDERIRNALTGLDVTIVRNINYAAGLSTSIAAGISALPVDIDGAFVVLGDMPNISASILNRMLAAFSPADGRSIVVPRNGAKRGNPILWSRTYFSELQALTGDQGAKALVDQHAAAVIELAVGTDAVLTDIDTQAALAAERRRRAQKSD